MLSKPERDRLVLEHQAVAHRAAKKAARMFSSLTIEDLQQEAMIGLMRAAELFDPSRGFKFSTYAYHWAFAFCRRAQFNTGSEIRTPVNKPQSRNEFKTVSMNKPVGVAAHFGDGYYEAGEWFGWVADKDSPSPEECVIQKMLLEEIMEHAHELSPLQRLTVQRTVIGDETVDQVAADRGVHRNGVRQQQAEGLKRLRQVAVEIGLKRSA